jgi:DnaJ-domain-containing protein 1
MSLPRRLWRLARESARAIPTRAPWLSDESSARRAAERELEEFLGSASSMPPDSPTSSPPHPLERHYRTLNVEIGANAETVERAWRRLVLQHHPDRFAADPAAERAANVRLREINTAHEELMRWLRAREERDG